MEQVRTCVGCKTLGTRKSLIRVVLVNTELTIDEGKKLPGRGAWLHPSSKCFELAVNRKAFGRALKQSVEVNEKVLALAIEQAKSDDGKK